MRLLLVALVLLWAAPVGAQDVDLTPLKVATVANLMAHGSDLATTEYALARNIGREANPVLAPFSHRPLAFGAAKMALASATTVARWELATRGGRKGRWIAFLWAVGETAIVTGVAIHNARVGR